MLAILLAIAVTALLSAGLYIFSLSRNNRELIHCLDESNHTIKDLVVDLREARHEKEMALLQALNAQKNLEMVLDPDPYLALDRAREIFNPIDDEATADIVPLNSNQTRSN